MKTMKSVLTILAVTACLTLVQAQNKPVTGENSKLTVYYFHAASRCATCLAIESNTKKTLQTYFSKELAGGTIEFRTVNVDEKANEELAERYEASGSALFLSKTVKGKEIKKDLTNFAFSYGRNNPEKFMQGLKEEIIKDLK